MKVLIARPIEGIPLNGNEYVVDDHGYAILFDTEDKAREYLYENGFSDELIEDCGITFEEQEMEEETE